MATGAMWSLCLLVCFQFGAARSESESRLLQQRVTGGGGAAENVAARAPAGAARALSSPSIADDGRLVACSGKDLLGFEPNGSLAWVVPLGHVCNHSIIPVFEGEQVYLVAEDKVIKVTPRSAHSDEPAWEVFFSHNSTASGRSEEIVGLAISGRYSSLFLTVRNRGLFAFSLRGELQWSVGPALNLFDYRLGCKRNVSGCYFDSAPVLDQCEGALYISNTEGQLYSLYIDSRGIRWIQDLSSHGKVMAVAPGNSARLYVVFPRKSIVVGIDVSAGNISWTQNIGPISSEKNIPTVDSNGWMSIGSLDGTLYSISPDGDMRKFLEKTANDSVIHVGPVLDCSGFSMYVAKTIVEGKIIQTTGDYTYVSAKKPSFVLFTLLAPANGTIYWTGEYPGELSNLLSSSDLNDFTIDETAVLSLLSAAKTGISNTTQCYTRRQKIAWTCRQAKAKFVQADPGEPSYILLLIFLLVVIIIQAVAILFCCIFWTKKRLRDNGLQKFLEKRRSLQSKRRILGKKILELEQKAAEDASSNEALGQLGEMVKAKEGVEKKLYGSYSLGRDEPSLERQGSSLPLYHGKHSRSHSFHSSQKESITIFNVPSDTPSSEDGTSSSCCNDSESCSDTSSGEMELDVRSTRPAEEAGPSNTANFEEEAQHELEKQHQRCSAS